MRVMVAGAGVWGAYIADHLVEQGHEVVVVEQQAAVAARERERGGRVVIAGDDEDNLVVSLLAKRSYGVPRVVARVNNPKNAWLFTQDWGVDTAVSAPAILTRLLDAAAAGCRVTDLDLPQRSVVVAVVRGEQVLPGGGSDPLEPGDEVLAVTALDAEPALRQALGGQAGGSHTPGS